MDEKHIVYKKLLNKIRKGNTEKVEKLLKNPNLDIHTKQEECFKLACSLGHTEIVKLLLSLEGNQRINIHENNDKAFKLACAHNNHEKVVELLLSLEGDQDIEGVRGRRINVHVLEEGFRRACCFGRVKTVELLLSLTGEREINVHAENNDAIISACFNGRKKIIKLLLSLKGNQDTKDVGGRKIDIHFDDEHCFRAACFGDNVNVVKLLLSLKGDREIDIHAENDEGFKTACEHGKLKMVELLLLKDKFNLSEVKTTHSKTKFLLECIQIPIDFDSRILEYRKEIKLMCVKQTLLNLCWLI